MYPQFTCTQYTYFLEYICKVHEVQCTYVSRGTTAKQHQGTQSTYVPRAPFHQWGLCGHQWTSNEYAKCSVLCVLSLYRSVPLMYSMYLQRTLLVLDAACPRLGPDLGPRPVVTSSTPKCSTYPMYLLCTLTVLDAACPRLGPDLGPRPVVTSSTPKCSMYCVYSACTLMYLLRW